MCPTCSAAMEYLTCPEPIQRCPRCGTVQRGFTVIVPDLVKRCRAFEDKLIAGTENLRLPWAVLGITEAINTPQNRRA